MIKAQLCIFAACTLIPINIFTDNIYLRGFIVVAAFGFGMFCQLFFISFIRDSQNDRNS